MLKNKQKRIIPFLSNNQIKCTIIKFNFFPFARHVKSCSHVKLKLKKQKIFVDSLIIVKVIVKVM